MSATQSTNQTETQTVQLSGIGYTQTILRLKLTEIEKEQENDCIVEEKSDEKISENKFNINGKTVKICITKEIFDELFRENFEDSLILKSKKIIIVALDFSGSMSSYFKQLMDIIKLLCDENPDADNIYIVTYGSYSKHYKPYNYPRDHIGNYRCGSYDTGGGTDFNNAFINVLKIVEENPDTEPILFFLTDGGSSGYQHTLEKVKNCISDIRPYCFGGGASISGLDNVRRVSSSGISEILEDFMSCTAFIVDTHVSNIVIETTLGTFSIPIVLNNGDSTEGNETKQGTVYFDNLQGEILSCSIVSRGISISLEKSDTLKLDDIDAIFGKLLSLVENQNPSTDMIASVCKDLSVIINDPELSDDPRTKSVKSRVMDILSRLETSSLKTDIGINSSAVGDIRNILKKMATSVKAMVLGKKGRSYRNIGKAACKISKYVDKIASNLQKWETVGCVPNCIQLLPQQNSEIEDTLLMSCDGIPCSYLCVNSISSASNLENVFNAMESDNKSLLDDIKKLAAVINNPAGANISVMDQILFRSTIESLTPQLLEKLALSTHALFLPYGNFDSLWLSQVWRMYAGMLLVGHPIEMGISTGNVFTTSLTSCLLLLTPESTHQLRALSFFLGYAKSYMNTNTRNGLLSDVYRSYSNDIMAFVNSRREGSDKQLTNIFSSFGAILSMITTPMYQESTQISFEDCRGLILSSYFENLRQHLQSQFNSPAQFDKALDDFSKTLGFEEYFGRYDEPNFDDFSSLIREFGRGNIPIDAVLTQLRDRVEINISDFCPDFSNIEELFQKYLPNVTNKGGLGTVSTILSIADIVKIIKLIKVISVYSKNVSKTNFDFIGISNLFYGILPEETCIDIIKMSESIPDIVTNETNLAMLIYLLNKNADSSKMILQPFGEDINIATLFNKSTVQRDEVKNRLKMILLKFLNQACGSEHLGSESPETLIGILKILKSIGFDEITEDYYRIISIINKVSNEANRTKLFLNFTAIIKNFLNVDEIHDKLLENGLPLKIIEMQISKMTQEQCCVIPSILTVTGTRRYRSALEILIDKGCFFETEVISLEFEIHTYETIDGKNTKTLIDKAIFKTRVNKISIKNIKEILKKNPELFKLSGIQFILKWASLYTYFIGNYECIGFDTYFKIPTCIGTKEKLSEIDVIESCNVSYSNWNDEIKCQQEIEPNTHKYSSKEEKRAAREQRKHDKNS